MRKREDEKKRDREREGMIERNRLKVKEKEKGRKTLKIGTNRQIYRQNSKVDEERKRLDFKQD